MVFVTSQKRPSAQSHMGSKGTIRLKDVWAMLDACTPGYTRKEQKHNWCVMHKELTYPSLPLGPHGRRENPEIEIGHIKRLVRFFGIELCAGAKIEALRL